MRYKYTESWCRSYRFFWTTIRIWSDTHWIAPNYKNVPHYLFHYIVMRSSTVILQPPPLDDGFANPRSHQVVKITSFSLFYFREKERAAESTAGNVCLSFSESLCFVERTTRVETVELWSDLTDEKDWDQTAERPQPFFVRSRDLFLARVSHSPEASRTATMTEFKIKIRISIHVGEV